MSPCLATEFAATTPDRAASVRQPGQGAITEQRAPQRASPAAWVNCHRILTDSARRGRIEPRLTGWRALDFLA
ncbi:hypothetical protein [Candidatus Amarolinea dominans]|uniref:hypothetical protein n=1 Tax=Candidatus Amarolinea dominans TaxID=3140696 RepID=UPI003136CD98|nr:hypothetical protein [Anaerolineae bacterium]